MKRERRRKRRGEMKKEKQVVREVAWES